MIVLRANRARFASRGDELVTPFSLVLEAGTRAELVQPTARAASIAARMCAAIVKPTEGTIYVGEYETRLQAPQAKRRVGFVAAGGFEGDAYAFRCEVAFVADVWGVPAGAAQIRAAELVRAFTEMHFSESELAYARAMALALVADVSLVVLDQPPARRTDDVRLVAANAGILATHVTQAQPAAPVASLVPAAT